MSKYYDKIIQFSEKTALMISFFTFSGGIPRLVSSITGESSDDNPAPSNVNDYIQMGAIGVLGITTSVRFVEKVFEYIKLRRSKSISIQSGSNSSSTTAPLLGDAKAKGPHPLEQMLNSLIKGAGLSVATYITLNKIIHGEDPQPSLLYSAFTLFTIVLGQRTYLAFKYGDRFDVIALGGMTGSTLISNFTTAAGSSDGTMGSLLVGALSSLWPVCNEVRKSIEQSSSKVFTP